MRPEHDRGDSTSSWLRIMIEGPKEETIKSLAVTIAHAAKKDTV